jgi:PTH1 family peptidyl-tRNA hydrolase
MESIIERLGTEDFPRLRLGINRPPGRLQAADYVLQDFSKAEAELLPMVLDRATDAVQSFIRHGIVTAMNLYNTSQED